MKKSYRCCHVDGVKRKCDGVCLVDGEDAEGNKIVIYRCPVWDSLSARKLFRKRK